MSPSDDRPKVDLEIAAPDGTEIFLLDHSLRMRASGIGKLSEAVAPGLYKIRFRAGDATSERYEEVVAGVGTIRLTAPDLIFSSPAPLANTALTRDHHQKAAARLSRETHASVGHGSQIFLFARSSTGATGSQVRHDPLRGLELHKIDGGLLVDVAQHSEASKEADSWAGCTIDLDPGSYRLRATGTAWGTLEQVLVASPDWQTQVFMLQEPRDRRAVSSGSVEGQDLDLVGATILQANLNAGFDWQGNAARQVELARIALANGRAVLPPETLQEMLTGKFTDPMLGILGAHALLRSGRFDRDKLDLVVTNLRRLLGSHPDVEALALILDADEDAPEYIFDTPPMLSSSWSLVVGASVARPALVPTGSLSAEISPHLWGPGPWLIWLNDDVDQGPVEEDPAAIEFLKMLSGTGEAVLRALRESQDDRLNDGEDTMLAWLAGPMVQPKGAPFDVSRAAMTPQYPTVAGPGHSERTTLDPMDQLVEQLASALGMPPATVRSLATSLAAKLSEDGGTGFPFQNQT